MATNYMRFTLQPAPGQSDRVLAVLLDLQANGWQEDGDRFVFWLAAEKLQDPDTDELLAELTELGELEAELEGEDWERRWRSLHGPVVVGNVCVRPPWTEAAPGAVDVVIDIGLAFGTGSHATTRECLQLLQRIEPGSLLDVGTGSGVLAIAASRLGYTPVTGIDNDPLAVAAAWENGMRNGVDATFQEADALQQAYSWPGVDVVVANLTLAPLVRLGERLAAIVRAGGAPPRDVIIAGLLDQQAGEAAAAFAGFDEHTRLSWDGWTAVHLKRCGTAGPVPGPAGAAPSAQAS